MSNAPKPVSEIYSPDNSSNHIENEPITEHYKSWGYSIGYEFDNDNKPVPETGNTAIFRIARHGLTEPVFVTKAEDDATFTVNVLSGKGLLIRAMTDGKLDQIPLVQGSEVVIRPGEAYSYINTDEADLVLHDVALPAFISGDDVELTSSLIPKQKPTPRENYSTCVFDSAEGQRSIDLPDAFFSAVSDAMK